MTRLRCISTVYMPAAEGSEQRFDRYEDERGEDVYEVVNDRVEEFLATGNFVPLSDPNEDIFQGGEIELSPDERTCLQALLPEAANASSLGIILGLQTQLKTSGAAKNLPKIIDIGAKGLEIITSEFRELNNQGELPLEWLQTYQRFN